MRRELESKIFSEMHKIHQKVDGSHFENIANSFDSNQKESSIDNSILQEFQEKIDKKVNKADIEMIIQQQSTMHKHTIQVI